MRGWMAFVVFAVLASLAPAQLSIYSDELDNGWDNWSWATTTHITASDGTNQETVELTVNAAAISTLVTKPSAVVGGNAK